MEHAKRTDWGKVIKKVKKAGSTASQLQKIIEKEYKEVILDIDGILFHTGLDKALLKLATFKEMPHPYCSETYYKVLAQLLEDITAPIGTGD